MNPYQDNLKLMLRGTVIQELELVNQLCELHLFLFLLKTLVN